MNTKQKVILRSSIILNALLAFIILWGLINTNFTSKQIFYTEVQWKLVELEGLINDQKDNNWSQPNLVTKQLGYVLNGINIGLSNRKQVNLLSNSDRDALEKLSLKLGQYPHDELYKFSSLTQADKDHFEKLQTKLRSVGLGLNISISTDWDSLMNQTKSLEESIEIPFK